MTTTTFSPYVCQFSAMTFRSSEDCCLTISEDTVTPSKRKKIGISFDPPKLEFGLAVVASGIL